MTIRFNPLKFIVENGNPSKAPEQSSVGRAPASAANGKIDAPFAQGNLSDCALLTTIFGLSKTSEGAKSISNSIKTNKNAQGKVTGYSVTFKGIGETYNISQEELEAAKKGLQGRKYSYGDDDMTILELAVEDCFESSKNKTLRSLVDNFTSTNASDKLNGVNPSSITYLFIGKTGEWDQVRPNGTILRRFMSNENYTCKDIDGNTVQFKKNQMYEMPSKTSSSISMRDCETGKNYTLNLESFRKNVLSADERDDKADAARLLKSFGTKNGSDVLVFGTNIQKDSTGSVPDVYVAGPNGTKVRLKGSHAYTVTSVKDGVATLLDPHDSKKTVKVNVDSLLGIENYYAFGFDF